MAKKFDASMFAKIKDSLAKAPTSSGSFANIMKFPAGKTYTLRLIPNFTDDDEDKTFWAHEVHNWKSLSDGSFVSALSLKTFGEKDPISNLRWKLWKEWKAANPGKENKEYEGVIQSKQQWFANVLVLDDPETPENNGQVKIIKIGPQLKEIIDIATIGNRSDEFGAAIFDLSKNGADFKIVAEKQGEYTTFKNSFFTLKTKFDLDEAEVDELYTKLHDLEAIIPVKTEDELKALLDEHYYCGSGEDAPAEKEERKPLARPKVPATKSAKTREAVEEPSFDDVDDDSDDIPFEFPEKKADGAQDDIQALIDGLDED